MFSIPNTSIPFQTYDADRGAIPAAQSWFFNQPISGGYLFCSTQPVYVRLTVGATFAEKRPLPEFFLPPGAQGVSVDYKSGGNYVWAVEVRAATSTVPQFWGVLATPNDPVGGYTPASYSVDANGSVVPVVITLAVEKDGAGVGNASILNLLTVGGVGWSPALLAGNQINLPVPPIGVQVMDAGQVNEVIVDFQNPLYTLVDDAANHRVKVTPGNRLFHTEYTADVTVNTFTDATAISIVTSPSVAINNAFNVLVSCQVQRVNLGGAATTTCTLCLFRDATELGRLSNELLPNLDTGPGRLLSFLDTAAKGLTTGNHTYTLKAFVNAGSATVGGGTGGGAVSAPGFIRAVYDQ